MAGSLISAQVFSSFKWNWSDPTAAAPLSSASAFTPNFAFALGTGSGSVSNKVAIVKYTLTASGTQVINLSGSIYDPGNESLLTFTAIRSWFIQHQSPTNSSGVSIGPYGASNPVTQWFDASSNRLLIVPNGYNLSVAPITAGLPVSPTNSSLLLTNLDSSNPATVQLGFIGE